MSGLLETLRMRVADLRGRGIYADYANEHQCIFIHIPKTAGVSISRALFAQEIGHRGFLDYERANPAKFSRFFKFSFVRNPWDRLVSSYFFLQAAGLNQQDASWAKEHLARYPDFQTFVSDWLSLEHAHSWIHFVPQTEFLFDEQDQLKVDYLGRFESLQADFEEVASRLGCQATLNQTNVGSHEDYRQYYNDALIERVASVYERDIRLLGYRFE